MPQMHLYVRDELADEIRRRAQAKGIPVSRYLGELIEREFVQGWPDGYFERVVGAWKGEPLSRRAPDDDYEKRDAL